MALTVGIVGLGIMGGAFARNLLSEGFVVVGYDIIKSHLDTLVKHGAIAASSPAEVATNTDILITSLPSSAAFKKVIKGKQGILSAKKSGLIVVECSTLPIDDKIVGRDLLQKVGTILLDCPISGTGAQAENKDLSIYGSGNEKAFNNCRPVFDSFAKRVFFIGEFGNGSKMKFVANHLVHIHNVASAEALVLGMKAGLEPETIFKVIKEGAGNSRIFELRVPMMIENNYTDATMKMGVWLKDMTTIGIFASDLECPTPLFNAGKDVYLSALSRGMEHLDTASVCKVLEDYAGIIRNKK